MGEELKGFHGTVYLGLDGRFYLHSASILQVQCQIPVAHATATIKRGCKGSLAHASQEGMCMPATWILSTAM